MHSPHTGKPIRIPVTEIFKTIPEFFGLRVNEEPDYQVITKDGPIEVRRYERQVLASVTVSGEYKDYQDEAFKRLAAYIFGNKVAMTSPVFQQRTGNGWTMTFVLPQKFTATTPPSPEDHSIQLQTIEPRTIVALRYGGNNTQDKMLEYRADLKSWLANHKELTPVGEAWWAQYDAPFVLPFAKRNEVQIEVRSLQ